MKRPLGPTTFGPSFLTASRMTCGLLPAAFAAFGATSTAPASHDENVVRVVGLGFTGAFRALDLLVAAPAMLLPLGTRALRAGLASAFVTGIAGLLAFDLALKIVLSFPAFGAGARTRLAAAVAAASVLTALLSPVWQVEAAAPGGSVIGALLVLTALRTVAVSPSPFKAALHAELPSFALLVGLGTSYDPWVGAMIVGVLVPSFVPRPSGGPCVPTTTGTALRTGAALVFGLLPLALGALLSQRRPEVALPVPFFAVSGASFDGGTSAAFSALRAFGANELGVPLAIVCGGGAALALKSTTALSRRMVLSLLAAVIVAALAVGFGHVPAGPSRFSPAVQAGVACAFILGATLLGAVVVAIARARVPFAEASAALVVVLEIVLPVKSMDETTARREARAAHAAAIWNDIAWGSAPPAAVILVADRGIMRRIASARAAGALREDLVMIPAFDVQGRQGQQALLTEPKLAPLYRDIALGFAPEELSLAQLSAERPVLATFDPKWDRALSRHLVPVGLISRFEPEPRGLSDRKQALDLFSPARDRLVRIVVAKKDPDLAAATAALLRARAVGMAATGEREILARSLDDLRPFAPEDIVGAVLVRRTVTTKGPIDVHDLAL
jgi:hypothetical protein